MRRSCECGIAPVARWYGECWETDPTVKCAPTHLKRYKDMALLFYKHARSEVAMQAGFGMPGEPVAKDDGGGGDLADDLERLGPTFIKIGQLLSTRADLLPEPYLVALSRLQDHVEPFPFEDVERIIGEQLGVRLSKAFESFDEKPIGAASLGQVHLATLRGGRKVAVKVQRPGIRQQIAADLDSLAEIAEFVDAHTEFGKRYEVSRVVEQFRTTLVRELDYQLEAHHLLELRENLMEFRRLRVPDVVADYSSSQVLTMEYLQGTKITALSGAVLADLDGDGLAEELFRAYLKQSLVDGLFHADPHPGNLLLTPERNIAIIDLGMVGRLHQRLRDQLVHLLAGIAEGDGVQTAEAAMSIGESRDTGIDRNLFINSVEELVGANKGRTISEVQVGAVILQVMQACAAAGLRLPAEISLLGKALMNLDRVGMTLSPAFDPNASIRRHLNENIRARMKDTATPANLLGVFTEVKDFLGQMPSRMNRILELVADNKLTVKVNSIDEQRLIQGMQKVANRITTGLILAALIVGSALLARMETSFRIFGYPGLAMLFFIIAIIGSMVLMVQIHFKDH